MSDPISGRVEYHAPFSFDNVVQLIERTRAAIMENWQAHADSDSEPAPYLDALQLPAAAQQVVEQIEAGKYEWSSGSRSAHTEHFSFSPVSLWVPNLSFLKNRNGTIGVELTVFSDWVRFESKGERARNRMLMEWEQDRISQGKPPRADFDPPEEGELDEEAYQAWWKRYDALRDETSVWPQNRQCLLNIVEHLKRALPVKSIELDPRLLEETCVKASAKAEQRGLNKGDKAEQRG